MDVYTIITERIIQKLETGTIPWHQPWCSIGAPCNLVSKKVYRGVNVWLLTGQGYTSPYWATMRQINELGGQVRKGEKSTPVVFWKIYVDGVEVKAGEPEPEAEAANGQSRRRFVLRYYSIFNSEQCELPATITDKLALPEQRQLDPIEACEQILTGMRNQPEIVHAGDKAFYSPISDRITMPPHGLFENAEEYWFHILARGRARKWASHKTQPRVDQRSCAVRLGQLLRRRNHCRNDRCLSMRNHWDREPHDRQLRCLYSRMGTQTPRESQAYHPRRGAGAARLRLHTEWQGH
jgi:antirestriction protein ArdC